MGVQVWPGGLVQGVTGPDLAMLPNTYLSSQALFLDNSQSAASDANTGTNPELPVRTLAYAASILPAAGTLVVGAGHVESISAQVNLATDSTIIGCTVGAQMPRFVNNVGGASSMLNVSARCKLWDMLFAASTNTAGNAKVSMAGGGRVTLHGCRFEQGAADVVGCIIQSGTLDPHFENCTFVSTGARPSEAILLNDVVAGIRVEDCTFDGGLPSYGWARDALHLNWAVTNLFMKNVLFQRGSIGTIGANATYQFYNVTSSEGGVPILFK